METATACHESKQEITRQNCFLFVFNQTDDMDQSCTSAKVVEIEQLPDFCIYLYILFLYVLPISPGCVRLHLSFNFFDYMTIDYTLVLFFLQTIHSRMQNYKSINLNVKKQQPHPHLFQLSIYNTYRTVGCQDPMRLHLIRAAEKLCATKCGRRSSRFIRS